MLRRGLPRRRRGTLGKIMLPAAAFDPVDDDANFVNDGFRLYMMTGSSNFVAPIPLPIGQVSIRKLTLFGWDNEQGSEVCAKVYRAQPTTGDEKQTGFVCTIDSAKDPQKPASNAINPRRVNTGTQGPYVWVSLGPDVTFYGVQVVYVIVT